MPRYFVHLAYKGTAFHGWQIQPNASTVQEELQKCLSVLCRQTVETTGCGRTDTGVHASQFFAHFDTEQPIGNTAQMVFQLNALLSRDIRIYGIQEVHADAHARFDAFSRSYSYYILRAPDPFLQELTWFNQRDFNLQRMNEAASLCLQHTDFACFAKTGGQSNSTICTVSACAWMEEGKSLRFSVSANRFLRGMVRAMVGTMAEVGHGKLSLEAFAELLHQGDRKEAGESVPPQGLFLESVMYPYLKLPASRVFGHEQ